MAALNSTFTQCLLFLTCEADKATELEEWGTGHVLMPAASELKPRLLGLFQRCGVGVLSSSSNAPASFASHTGHIEIIELLFSDPKTKRLQVFVEESCVKAVRLLLGKSVTIKKTEGDLTISHYAVQDGNSELMDSFLAAKLDFHLRDSKSSTLLHLAILRDDAVLFKMLLRHGTDVSCPRSDGSLPLSLAAQKANFDFISVLLEKDVNQDFTSAFCQKLLCEAVLSNSAQSTKVVEQLLQRGCKLDVDGKDKLELLQAAIKNNYVEVAEQVIKLCELNDINPKSKDDRVSPLTLSVKLGRHNIMKMLLNNGAVPDEDYSSSEDDSTPLLEAVKNSDVTALELLFAHKAKPNEKLLNPAVINGDKDVVEMLLINGADPDRGDLDLMKEVTPLINAVDENDLELVHLLIQYKADVNRKGKDGKTPLIVACENGCTPIIEYLIRNGADVNMKNRKGVSPMSCAVKSGYIQAVDMLLKLGANYVYQPAKASPLHLAALERHKSIFQALLNYGFCNEHLLDQSGICDLFQESWVSGRSRKDPFLVFYKKHGCSFKRFAVMLARHMIKMSAAGICYDELCREPAWYCKELSRSEFLEKCESEIANMKVEFIPGTGVTFYDILIGGSKKLTGYARNQNIVKVIKKKYFIKRFPIYAGILNCQLQKGIFQKTLLEKSIKMFRAVCKKSVDLPQDLAEKIFGYLQNQDIVVFMNTVSPMAV